MKKGLFNGPNANMYSLESITRRKFFFPDLFSRFTKFLYNLVLAHPVDRGRVFGDYLSYFMKMLLGFLSVSFFCFHCLLPFFKTTTKLVSCQGEEMEAMCVQG